MKKLYTDASFSWQSTAHADNIVRGKIAVYGDGVQRVEKVAVGKVEGLTQYINVLELTAIARAIELMCEEKEKPESLAIFTDSKTAMIWASSMKMKNPTPAHTNAMEYLRNVRLLYGGLITFYFVRRDLNPAGKLLEVELEREVPHAI